MKRNEADFEGRKRAFMDIDRMTNEGLAGGQDHITYGKRQIDESLDLHEEDPPHEGEVKK
ncbi:hypothetical protein [Alteribacter populi]|uniref:hypothetical protein n=1 Tax=Alteribacter populi TaxID=2011011 RepID=UPI000BBAF2D7|nr:hypothetical protein [Alteribacter populi]